MRAYFDTETSGLPDWHDPSDYPKQPFLVEFAALLEDDEGIERGCFHWVVYPGGNRTIPKEASDIHGITTEIANKIGVPLSMPVHMFMSLIRIVGSGEIVAHDIKFDLLIMKIAMLQFGIPLGETELLLGKVNQVCTMTLATPIVNLPPTQKMIAAGFQRPKSANLSECYRYFIGGTLEGAHSALSDARACREVYKAILLGGHGR